MLEEARRFSVDADRTPTPFRLGVTSRIGPLPSWKREADFLFVQVDGQSGADLVFMVKKSDVFEDAAPAPAPKAKGATSAPTGGGGRASIIKPGTFLEVKRLARVDLSNLEAPKSILPPDPKIAVMRKVRLKAPPAPPQG